MGDSLCLGQGIYESLRIWAFCLLSHIITAPYPVTIVGEQKGLQTGHTNHPALKHFSSKVPKPNSDHLTIHITPQSRALPGSLH